MSIPTQPATTQVPLFELSQTKLARIEAMDAWLNQIHTPNLAQQDAACRVPIEIGAFTTYWQLGISPSTPPFLVTASQGARYVLVYAKTSRAVVVFERCGRVLAQRAILTDATQMLAALPDRALEPSPASKPATDKQLETLRKVLDVAPEKEFPPISAAMCSRLIDRVLTEKTLARMADQLSNCVAELVQEPSLAHE